MFVASGTLIVPPLWAGRTRRFIHRSAWNRFSANFAFWAFSELRPNGVPRSSHGLGPAGASGNAPVVFGELYRILDREGRARRGSDERSRHDGRARPAARNLGIHDASLGHVRTRHRSAAVRAGAGRGVRAPALDVLSPRLPRRHGAVVG